jgi:hypothetical protein
LAARRTTKRSVRTPAASLVEAIGRKKESIAAGYFFARKRPPENLHFWHGFLT